MFWKEVRSHTNVLSKVATKVDGDDSDEGIATVFYEKFNSISGVCNNTVLDDQVVSNVRLGSDFRCSQLFHYLKY